MSIVSWKHASLIAVGLLIITIIMSVPTIKQPISSDWAVVGRLGDDAFRFVQITPGLEKNRSVYDKAVLSLCHQPASPSLCVLTFFAQGDRIPVDQARGDFFRAGGFRDYMPLAIYWNTSGGEFKKWDCERAGWEGSPLSALCGPGVAEAYSASGRLGVRTSTARACDWSQTEDAVHFASYLLTVQNLDRREQYREHFNKMNNSKRPDKLSDCLNLRAKIEDNAKIARDVLGIIQPASPPVAEPAKIVRRLRKA